MTTETTNDNEIVYLTRWANANTATTTKEQEA